MLFLLSQLLLAQELLELLFVGFLVDFLLLFLLSFLNDYALFVTVLHEFLKRNLWRNVLEDGPHQGFFGLCVILSGASAGG